MGNIDRLYGGTNHKTGKLGTQFTKITEQQPKKNQQKIKAS